MPRAPERSRAYYAGNGNGNENENKAIGEALPFGDKTLLGVKGWPRAFVRVDAHWPPVLRVARQIAACTYYRDDTGRVGKGAAMISCFALDTWPWRCEA